MTFTFASQIETDRESAWDYISNDPAFRHCQERVRERYLDELSIIEYDLMVEMTLNGTAKLFVPFITNSRSVYYTIRREQLFFYIFDHFTKKIVSVITPFNAAKLKIMEYSRLDKMYEICGWDGEYEDDDSEEIEE